MTKNVSCAVEPLLPVELGQGKIKFAQGVKADRWVFATGLMAQDFINGIAPDVLSERAPHSGLPKREKEAQSHYFRGTRWERINDETRAAYLANSYRVLLTRARQGMVICVPVGSEIDDTRMLNFYDETYAFLCECGITKLV
jgi:hypothetical protein